MSSVPRAFRANCWATKRSSFDSWGERTMRTSAAGIHEGVAGRLDCPLPPDGDVAPVRQLAGLGETGRAPDEFGDREASLDAEQTFVGDRCIVGQNVDHPSVFHLRVDAAADGAVRTGRLCRVIGGAVPFGRFRAERARGADAQAGAAELAAPLEVGAVEGGSDGRQLPSA